MNILFVCTGNTCRSPMAEGIMNKIAADNDLDITAKSAGIFAEEGAGASKEAIEAAQAYDVDISEHAAQLITEKLLTESDIILTMTEAHKHLLSGLAGEKVFTVNEYAGLEDDISDPFGGDLEEYQTVCTEIHDAIVEIAEKLADRLLKNTNE